LGNMTARYCLRALVLACLLVSGHVLAQSYPRRVSQLFPGTDLRNEHPYSSVGFVGANVGGKPYEGSAAIAVDKRLILTCAHVLYEKGRWAEIVGFTRAADSRTRPSDDGTVFVRGLYKYFGYSGLKKRGYDFDLDFAVAFTTREGKFGDDQHVLKLNDSSGSDPYGLWRLRSGTYKTVLGYPSYLDYNFTSGYYYMHQTGGAQTGYFTDGIFKEYDSYYETEKASTGPGNSGGPLLVWDGNRGEYLLAGILVSGFSYYRGYYGYGAGAGFYILDGFSRNLAQEALDDSEGSGVIVGNTTLNSPLVLRKGPLSLPDGSFRYVPLKISFSRLPRYTTKVLLDLDIDTARPSDVDVLVRSPKGRVYVLASSDPALPAKSFKLDDHDISGAFLAADPNGRWQIFVRDAEPNGYQVTVNSASLRVTSR